MTAEQVDAAIADARQTLGELAPLVDVLVDAMAAENTSGRVRLSRTLSALWLPVVALLDTMSRDQIRYGLTQAAKAGAPNVNYIRKAAANGPQTRGDHHDRPAAARPAGRFAGLGAVTIDSGAHVGTG